VSDFYGELSVGLTNRPVMLNNTSDSKTLGVLTKSGSGKVSERPRIRESQMMWLD